MPIQFDFSGLTEEEREAVTAKIPERRSGQSLTVEEYLSNECANVLARIVDAHRESKVAALREAGELLLALPEVDRNELLAELRARVATTTTVE